VIILFQEHDFEVIVKPRRLNLGPNHLSRIEIGEEPTNLEEGSLDAQLFVVRVIDSHFVDIIHSFTIGMTLEGYSTQHKKELVVCANFSVIVGHLLLSQKNDRLAIMY